MQLYYYIYIAYISIVSTYVSYPQVAAVTKYRGYCTRCAQKVSLTDYPASRFRAHPCEQDSTVGRNMETRRCIGRLPTGNTAARRARIAHIETPGA